MCNGESCKPSYFLKSNPEAAVIHMTEANVIMFPVPIKVDCTIHYPLDDGPAPTLKVHVTKYVKFTGTIIEVYTIEARLYILHPLCLCIRTLEHLHRETICVAGGQGSSHAAWSGFGLCAYVQS